VKLQAVQWTAVLRGKKFYWTPTFYVYLVFIIVYLTGTGSKGVSSTGVSRSLAAVRLCTYTRPVMRRKICYNLPIY